MLNFIFWGVTLNCYAFTILVLIERALFPNGFRKKCESKLLPMVIATFTPYFAFVLGIAIFLSMAYYKFDADKIEARLEKRR